MKRNTVRQRGTQGERASSQSQPSVPTEFTKNVTSSRSCLGAYLLDSRGKVNIQGYPCARSSPQISLDDSHTEW